METIACGTTVLAYKTKEAKKQGKQEKKQERERTTSKEL
jgi:hypothetical protein